MLYFSTFISGFSSLVEKWLKENVSDVDIKELLDGLVIYKTSVDVDKVKVFPIFNNSFILLQKLQDDKVPIFDFEIDARLLKTYKTFRVIYSNQNQITKIHNDKLNKYERGVAQITGLKVDRTNPDTEFWILKRSENFTILIGLRLTKNPNLEKTLNKGELRPQLAYLLNYLSEPKSSDIFLDPFAGYGSIPKARIKYFPAKEVIVNENKRELTYYLKQTLKEAKVIYLDALNLKSIEDNSIDKIVTDPPWGLYDKNIKIEDFYSKMLNKFTRIIKSGG